MKNEKVNELLRQYPEFEKLAEEIEKKRDRVDDLEEFDDSAALRFMMEIDTDMLKLMDYHVRLSTECLKLDRG